MCVALAVATACGPAGYNSAQPAQQTAIVFVKNMNWAMMRVYVFEGRSSSPFRLCTVETETTMRCVLRLHADLPVRFMYSPLAGAEPYVTDDVYLQPGDTLRLNIQQYLPFSSMFLDRPQ